MDTNKLLDNWFESGTDYAEFERIVNMLSESTSRAEVYTNKIELLSLDSNGVITDEKTPIKAHDTASYENKSGGHHLMLSTSTAFKAGFTLELLREFQTKSKLLFKYGKQTIFTSSGLSRDLGARADLMGPALYEPSEERDAYLVSRYNKEPKKAIAIIRHGDNEKVKKIFALPSSGYCYVPQNFICRLLDIFKEEMGGLNCRKWFVNHNITQIWVEFPEVAEDMAKTYKLPGLPTPGIFIETSDTGDCSVNVAGTWSTKLTAGIRGEGWSRKHYGSFSIDDVVNGVKENVFAKYTMLPERLCELSLIEVEEPEALIAIIMNELKASKTIGRKRASDLTNALKAEVNAGGKYTAYDIAMMILDLPSRCSFPDTTEDALVKRGMEKMVYKAPFLRYEDLVENMSSLVLMPASA